MSRLSKYKAFKHIEYSLIKEGKTRWKAKYPTQKNLDDQRDKVGATAWQREYLLKVVPEGDRMMERAMEMKEKYK